MRRRGDPRAARRERGGEEHAHARPLRLLAPDGGTIEVLGRPARYRSPREAMAAGIGMVHRHFTQVPELSVAENVWLGQPGFRYDARAARAAVRAVGEQTGFQLDPDACAGDLAMGHRQRLEIVKELSRDVKILLLDEPTAVLTPHEAQEVFTALRLLADRGVAVALIMHKLREVFGVDDRVTVLRAGVTVLTGDASRLDAESLTVRRGLAATGVAAVEGNGQREGLLLDFSVTENLALGGLRSWWIDYACLEREAERAVTDFDIRSAGPATAAWRLSGGNQQKLVLARELVRRPALIVAENPTRGLDVRATAEVHARLVAAARRDGAGVLFYSPDLDEVLAVADRIAVMADGRWTPVPVAARSRERVGALMLGAGSA